MVVVHLHVEVLAGPVMLGVVDQDVRVVFIPIRSMGPLLSYFFFPRRVRSVPYKLQSYWLY